MRQPQQKQSIRYNNELHDSFMAIYTDHSDTIFRFCCIRVSDRDEALDITQDVFSRLWQSMLDGNNIEYPRTFLFTVTRNRIIDWYRKKKSLSLESLADRDTDEPYEPIADDAETSLRMGAEGRFLVDQIKRLSSGYRDVVYLRFVEGLPPGDIAKIIGASVNATSVRITRGLDELRKLTGYDIDNSSLS